MTTSSIQNSFVAGEISPSLYGRCDLAKWHQGGSTIRNAFVNYRGGATSRAGLAFVGVCKQAGTSLPPRDIDFQFSITQGYALEFGDYYMRIKYLGGYVLESSITVTSVSSAGLFTTSTNHGLSVGDWIYDNGNVGFSALAWIITATTSNTFTVEDMFGNAITSATPSTGGSVARIYTLVTPYQAVDLPYLKYSQDADVMTLTCSNPTTNNEYPIYNLERFAATNWTLTQQAFTPVITAPANVVATAQSSTTTNTYYSYVVTAVDRATGQESVASASASVENNNISIYAGSNTITWNNVANAASYNVYKATPSYSVPVPVGVTYGYIGTSFGGSFVDSNITEDFTHVPPIYANPFARGAINSVNMTAFGTGYSQSTVSYSISTSTGAGFVGTPIVVNGAVVAFYVINAGYGYQATDTISFTDTGGGTGATATLSVGAESGTYPGVTAYYQQRRFYANSFNFPDTYWASQTGDYTNMDTSIPVMDSDAITGTPWAQQINGIQAMVPMPNGIVVFTGKGAWQVNGGNSLAFTPSSQTATQQGSTGCSPIVQPIPINQNILHVQSLGGTVKELEYNYYAQIFISKDMTILANHLFYNNVIIQWAYAEEPFKVIWCVRSDGIMLSFTYLKEQDVYAWARHDTNGLFVSVCTVTEPPINAVYTIVKRYVNGKWFYYSERMANRIWENVEESFCVDAGLTNQLNTPNATLNASQSAVGANVTFTASASVFTNANVGDVIRTGGGNATVTSYVSGTQVIGTLNQAITATIPNDPNNTPIAQTAGNWIISTPITTVTNLNHLEGMTVSILADGGVVTPQVVTNNSITLPQAASYICVGLPYTVQVQTLYLDPQGQPVTVQGKRKTIFRVTVRLEASRGITVGTNQPDSSTQPNYASPAWTNMKEVKERNANILAGNSVPLFTGDHIINVVDSWQTKGQVAVQSIQPLPCSILAVVPEYIIADSPG